MQFLILQKLISLNVIQDYLIVHITQLKVKLYFSRRNLFYILNANGLVILYITSKSLRLLRSCYKLLTRNKIIFHHSIITQYFLNIIIKIRIKVIYIFSLVIEQRVLRVFLGYKLFSIYWMNLILFMFLIFIFD